MLRWIASLFEGLNIYGVLLVLCLIFSMYKCVNEYTDKRAICQKSATFQEYENCMR